MLDLLVVLLWITHTEAERKKFRDKLLQTEQQLAAAKGREHALQQQLLKEVNDNQERFKKQLESQANLEVKLENEKNLRQKAESSAASAEEKASVLEGKLGHLSESIEREKKHHNTELALLNRESKHSVSRIRADLETMECRAKNAEKESELWKEQLEDLKRQFTECSHQRSELEKKLSSFTFQEGSSTDSNILVKHLQEELRNFVGWIIWQVRLMFWWNCTWFGSVFVFYSGLYVLLLKFDFETPLYGFMGSSSSYFFLEVHGIG